MQALTHGRTLLLVFAAVALAGPAAAQKSFRDVGKQPPITIVVNSSPWYPGFEKLVGIYEQQTGNKIKLDVVPFGGLLEKARNAVRSGQSPYDIVTLDPQWTIEFYEGGFLTPMTDFDPGFGRLAAAFRPEALVVDDRGPLEGRVSVVETLGPETCVFFDVGPTVLCTRMDRARRLDVGATVRLSVPSAAIRLFDAATGARLSV